MPKKLLDYLYGLPIHHQLGRKAVPHLVWSYPFQPALLDSPLEGSLHHVPVQWAPIIREEYQLPLEVTIGLQGCAQLSEKSYF